jgi:hypothetical protein
MITLLKLKLPETLRAVAPLIIVVCVLQFTVVGAPTAVFLQFLAGSVLVTVGLLLLLTGIDFGILPMGRFIGAKLAEKGSLWLLLIVAFALGFATTAAEPDVLVLAGPAGHGMAFVLHVHKIVGVADSMMPGIQARSPLSRRTRA